ncbi:hypothetical protein [Moorena producens]|uniref:hypothetical protein n=1 Tax=Moorena producens TaxID=1155739 RepID=UPI000A84C508|nr:hypothetical protein [Moorena producens]
MQSLMGETTAVAHGGDPQDRAASPRPRCIALASVPFLGGVRGGLLLPLASCLLPLASCLLPLASCLFPIPYSLE